MVSALIQRDENYLYMSSMEAVRRSSMKGVAVVVKYSSYLKWMTIVVFIYIYYVLLGDINNKQKKEVGKKNSYKFHSLEYSQANVIPTIYVIQYGETPLHYACLYGRLEVATFLVREGASMNIQNKVSTRIGYVSFHICILLQIYMYNILLSYIM